MSCRVLKRGVEQAAFNAICDYAREWGCKEVVGEYIPTKKNHMVSNLLPDLGFEKSMENGFGSTDDGGNAYKLELTSANRKEHHITIERF
jgi:predicted enzyme involved in methoxymalonyl-ACP biosynthesis